MTQDVFDDHRRTSLIGTRDSHAPAIPVRIRVPIRGRDVPMTVRLAFGGPQEDRYDALRSNEMPMMY